MHPIYRKPKMVAMATSLRTSRAKRDLRLSCWLCLSSSHACLAIVLIFTLAAVGDGLASKLQSQLLSASAA